MFKTVNSLRMAAHLSLKDIHPLTDFQRNTKKHLKRLKKTKRPEILTVNGKAEVVVIDAAAYDDIIEEMSHLETVNKLRAAIEEAENGKGILVESAFKQIRATLSSGKR